MKKESHEMKFKFLENQKIFGFSDFLEKTILVKRMSEENKRGFLVKVQVPIFEDFFFFFFG